MNLKNIKIKKNMLTNDEYDNYKHEIDTSFFFNELL